MNGFELSLNGITYKCNGNHCDKDHQNWLIGADIDGFRVHVDIPIESKLSRLQAMAFVERFHVALTEAKKDQRDSIKNSL